MLYLKVPGPESSLPAGRQVQYDNPAIIPLRGIIGLFGLWKNPYFTGALFWFVLF